MERNKWETAIRCLEVALHPRTADDEVIAAVNGFRRTAAGGSLRAICAALAGQEKEAPEGNGPIADFQAERQWLIRENAELRRALTAETEGRTAALRRARAAERRVEELTVTLAEVRKEVEAASGQSAALIAAYRARNDAPRPSPAPARPTSPFQTILANARERDGTAESINLNSGHAPYPRTPWTA